MPWSTTRDVREFDARAGAFLSRRPVDHTALLTETAYLLAQPTQGEPFFGWYGTGDGAVAGAFVQAPRHVALLSRLSADAAESLADTLPGAPGLGVDARDADAVVAAWRSRGTSWAPRSRFTVHRLVEPRRSCQVHGEARTATATDRPLLVRWFEQLMAAHPNDPSDLAYVVDDPLDYGGITLWVVDGAPVAMAGRSREVAGMVRLSAVYAPSADADLERAAVAAAAARASHVASDVLVLSASDDDVAAREYAALGFEPVLERILLAPAAEA